METVQETIDNLISYIDAAVAKHSVSNRHVATVLEFLNSGLKTVRENLSSLDDKYLNKKEDDVSRGFITFLQGLLSKGDLTIGDFIEQGDAIQGARVTKEGHASFASVKSPYMEIFELILNRQTATGGELRISDVGTIDGVTYLFSDGSTVPFSDYDAVRHGLPYGALLMLREEYEGYVTSFKYDDIVYGYVNGIGQSGAYARRGQFYGVVKDVVDERTLKVNIYSNAQVPTGSNLLPVPHMVITQRGNETNKMRQSVITLSSLDKSVVILRGVDSPVLAADGSCYGVSLGRLPDVLYESVVKAYPYLDREDMSVYAKNLIVQNLIQLDDLGQTIKTERYRGLWDEKIAESDSPYRLTGTFYDTVSHDGCKWSCQCDRTKVPPSKKTTEWSLIVGKDELFMYEFITSPSTVFVKKDGSISAEEIFVAVGEVSNERYDILTSNEQLAERGLKVQYSINNSNERADFDIRPFGPITLEDNEVFFTSETSSIFMLEGKGLQVNPVDDSVTLYLVDIEKNIDRLVYVIPIVKNGLDGASPSINLLNNTAFDLLDENGKLNHWSESFSQDIESHYEIIETTESGVGSKAVKLSTTAKEVFHQECTCSTGVWYFLSFYARTDKGGELNVRFPTFGNCYSNGVEVNFGTYGISINLTTSWQKYVILFKVSSAFSYNYIGFASYGQSVNFIAQPKLEICANQINPNESEPTSWTISRNDLVGPVGDAGPSYYPCGNWIEGERYEKEEGSVPYVYYDDDPFDDNEGLNYLLKSPSVQSSIPPPLDPTNWTPMTKFRAIHAMLLLADWALFGGKDGGVFYKGFLFSQDGVDADGAARYSSYKADMWNGSYLSGVFQPNLFLDFLRGAIKSNKLSETFMEFDYSKPCNILDIDESYNVSVIPGNVPGSGMLLSMPLVNDILDGKNILVAKAPWQPEGMKSTILVRESDLWNKVVQLAEREIYATDSIGDVKCEDFKNCLTSGIVLCADSRVINQYSYKTKTYGGVEWVVYNPGNYNENGEPLDTAQYGGFFVCKGRLTKFLFVEPGMMVRLRSCSASKGLGGAVGGGGRLPLWYVENSEDFEEIPASVTVYVSYVYKSLIMEHPTFDGKWMEGFGIPFAFGHYSAGTGGTSFEFKNFSFATKGIAVVDKFMRENHYSEYLSDVTILTKTDEFSINAEDNIKSIYQSQVTII